MQMANHVKAIQADLAAAAALGDEAAAEAGRRLSEALESSLYVRLLDILTEAAVGLSGTLPAGHVEVRLAGREPELVFVLDASGEAEPQPLPGEDASARITLRLPESLKLSVEEAAIRESLSTNAWIVRALARALEPRQGRTVRTGNRLQGFAQS
jgi:predicted HicB family RNase H-like nuclease